MEFNAFMDLFRLSAGVSPFLFWLFLGGIIVATMQDLKRREVDDWLNLFLFVSGLTYVFYGGILSGDLNVIFLIGSLVVVMFGVMNLFYYGRVFAGGDAKLLFAMSAFFLGVSFVESMKNVGIFLLFLMVSGSIYGLFYSGVLWFNNRKKVNNEIGKLVKKNKLFWFVGFVGFVLMVLGVLHFFFFLVGVLIFIFPFLYVFTKGLENVSMIREVSGVDLREGDWLAEDVVVGSGGKQKTIKADWDGLSLENIELLRKRKKVLIKDGLPFVPAFLIAFVSYVFLRDWFLGFFIF